VNIIKDGFLNLFSTASSIPNFQDQSIKDICLELLKFCDIWLL